jgi:hypothetical protein
MSETLILSVPETLLTEFVVAAPKQLPPGAYEPAAGPAEVMGPPPRLWCPTIQLRRADVTPMNQLVHAAVCPDCDYGFDAETRQRVAGGGHFIFVSCAGTAAWPPMHMTLGALAAAAHALATGGVILDVATAAPLRQPNWQHLPSEAETFPIGMWISATGQSAGEHWNLHTTGLSRFGLPDLTVRNIPVELCSSWTLILAGAARRLLLDQWNDLADNRDQPFREIPAIATITADDIETAVNLPHPLEPASIDIGLELDLETAHYPSLLQILPPCHVGVERKPNTPDDIAWRRDVAHRLLPRVLAKAT